MQTWASQKQPFLSTLSADVVALRPHHRSSPFVLIRLLTSCLSKTTKPTVSRTFPSLPSLLLPLFSSTKVPVQGPNGNLKPTLVTESVTTLKKSSMAPGSHHPHFLVIRILLIFSLRYHPSNLHPHSTTSNSNYLIVFFSLALSISMLSICIMLHETTTSLEFIN